MQPKNRTLSAPDPGDPIVRDRRYHRGEPTHNVATPLPLPVLAALDAQVARLKARGLSVSRGSLVADIAESVLGRAKNASDAGGRVRIAIPVTGAVLDTLRAIASSRGVPTVEALVPSALETLHRRWGAVPPDELPGVVESACIMARRQLFGTAALEPNSPRTTVKVSLPRHLSLFLNKCVDIVQEGTGIEALPRTKGGVALALTLYAMRDAEVA